MDVIVTENLSRARRFRVNDVSSTKEACSKIASLPEDDGKLKSLPAGVTLEPDGSENVTYQTQPAPPRPVTPKTQ